MVALVIALLITVLDQLTKQIVRLSFALGESRPVIEGCFDLTYLRNTGAAWGILGGQNTSLTVISLVILIVMVIFRRSFLSDTLEHRIALGLMVGGIVGNLLDRMRQGWVTDFLDFYVGNHHWPAFNVADAAICVGVGIYILSSLWISTHPLADRRSSDSSDAERKERQTDVED
ncbi:MAG: signal peptidase II [Verrucomicrobia bacterium]|nr:signal peptidase II [Verrucomicrobiota bacterium]